MEKQRSLASYRAIDLMLWAAILVIFEGIILRTARSMLFADQAFTVSLAAAITSIVFMRWGVWGGIHAALAGAVFALLGGGTRTQMLIYTGGNLLALAIVPVMNRIGRERIRQSAGLSLAVSLGTLVLMQTGRALLVMTTGAGISGAIHFFTTDSLSAVFTMLIIWIARRMDGLYEDQRHYLRRLQKEQEKERMDSL